MKNIGKNLIRIRNVAKNELIYIGSDILIKAIAFVSMPFFLNVMTPEDFGEFNLYITYSSIFAIFFGLNVSNAIVRYYVDRAEGKKYLATAVWILVIGGAISSSLIFGLHYVFGFFEIGSKILAMALINTAFSGLVNIGLEVIRSEKNVKLYAASSVLNSVLSTALGLVLVYTIGENLAFWRLISVCGSGIIVGGLLTIRLMYRDGIKGNIDTAKYLLSYSIPLIPYTLSTTILTQVNKLFLAKTSLYEVGIYSFASNLAIIVYIISMALNRSLQPNLFEALRDKKDYRNHLKKNMVIFYFFYIGSLLGTDILIWIFGNQSYKEAANIIPILILGYGYCFLYSTFSGFLYYYKKNMVMSTFSISSALVVVGLNIVLIPKYSYIGAACATMLSYMTLFLLAYWYVSKKLKISVFGFKTIVILQISLILPVIIKIFIGVIK